MSFTVYLSPYISYCTGSAVKIQNGHNILHGKILLMRPANYSMIRYAHLFIYL